MSGVTAAIDSLGVEIIIPALLLLVALLPFLLNANRNQALGLLRRSCSRLVWAT